MQLPVPKYQAENDCFVTMAAMGQNDEGKAHWLGFFLTGRPDNNNSQDHFYNWEEQDFVPNDYVNFANGQGGHYNFDVYPVKGSN